MSKKPILNYRDYRKLKKMVGAISLRVRTVYQNLIQFIDKRPLTSFFSLLAILFLLIIVGNVFRRPSAQPTVHPPTKTVDVYKIGTAPKIILQAQVEKSGVVQVTALTGGIIQNIYVKEGAFVAKGQWLASLTSNYQGGNALAIARQIAEKQNQNIEESYPIQKDLIAKQKDLATQSETNFENLRNISAQSTADTQNLINLNATIIASLDNSINALQSNPSSTSASLILASQQMKSQFLSANLQLTSALRNTQYQSDSGNPPTQLAATQRDITLKQLDIGEKALNLNRELSKLQLELARVNEGSMYPSAPFPATVERVFVRIGQTIAPGMPIALLSESIDPSFIATVYASEEIADRMSRLEPSLLTVEDKTLSLYPTYITREAVQGNLYGITYTLPQEEYVHLTDKAFIAVQIPIGYADTSASMPYIPLDSVYQTQEDAYVFIADHGTAKSKKITLGDVYGQYVQALSGLENGSIIILNRNVVDGDTIDIK